jgi:hypothetical protein
MPGRISIASLLFALSTLVAPCQQEVPADTSQSSSSQVSENGNQHSDESKRILGLIPNYRTSPTLQDYQPLSSRQKFKMASEDAFDRGTVALAVLFGADGQITSENRSFGQGAAGFARYFGAAYGDLVIGDYMTEAVFPSLLHQDPRYFRRGNGTGWSRLGYAVGRIFFTQTDSGGQQCNYSEIVGNSTAVAISNAYYANNRTASDAVSQLGLQIGVDMAGNVLKEFWPDLQKKFKRRNAAR